MIFIYLFSTPILYQQNCIFFRDFFMDPIFLYWPVRHLRIHGIPIQSLQD